MELEIDKFQLYLLFKQPHKPVPERQKRTASKPATEHFKCVFLRWVLILDGAAAWKKSLVHSGHSTFEVGIKDSTLPTGLIDLCPRESKGKFEQLLVLYRCFTKEHYNTTTRQKVSIPI